MQRLRRIQSLGTLEEAISRRYHPARIQVCGESSRIGIQSEAIESPPLFIRFAKQFDLDPVDLARIVADQPRDETAG